MLKTITVFLLFFLSFSSFADKGSASSILPKNAVVRDFTENDLQLLLANEIHALDHYADGSKLTWRNPETGHSGYLIPLSTKMENARICRTMLMVNRANGREGRATLKFCKTNKIWHMYMMK